MKRKVKLSVVLLPLLLWLLLVVYINIVPPDTLFSYVVFYALATASLLVSLKLFFRSIHSIFLAFIAVSYLLLRQNHLDNILNTILLIGLTVTINVYFRKA